MSSEVMSAEATLGHQTARRGPLAIWGRLLRSEIGLVFGRWRNRLLLIGLACVPVLIGLAVYFFGDAGAEGGQNLFERISHNGVFLVFASFLVCLPLFLPVTVSVIGGDALAGEAQLGTMRYLLSVPVPRTRLLLAKATASWLFVAAAIAIVSVVGLAVGTLLFGARDLVLLSGDTVSMANAIARAAGAAAYLALSFAGLLAVALMFSALTSTPLAAMAATIMVSIAATVLEAIPQLAAIQPYLLTSRPMDFIEFTRLHIDGGTLAGGLAVQAGWLAVCGSIAWARFTTADITS